MNPFVKNRINYNISKNEKIIRKNEYYRKVPFENDAPCVKDEIVNSNNLEEFFENISQLDMYTLLQMVVLKSAKESPNSFNEFLLYGEQAVSLVSCLKCELENLAKIDNTVKTDVNFDFGLEIQEIFFDWGKEIRISIEQIITEYLFKIVKNLWIEALDFIDCNSINKCIVSCCGDDPYKNILTKTVLKNTDVVSSNIRKKLLDPKYRIDKEKVKEKDVEIALKQFLENSVPEEINCVFSGIRNSDLIKRLENLLNKDEKKVNKQFILDLMTDLPDYVDFVPITLDQNINLNNPCGLISLDNVAKIKLLRKGYTEQEANAAIQENIARMGDKLNTISSILQDRSLYNSDLLLNDPNYENSEITKTIINNSIDFLFDSLNIKNNTFSLYKRDLKPTGDICLAYFYILKDIIQSYISFREMSSKITSKISPPGTTPNGFDISNYFLEETFQDSFYDRFLKGVRNLISRYNIVYNGDIITVSYNNENIAYCNKYDLFINDSAISIDDELDRNYIETYSRNNLEQIFTSNNNDPELLQSFNLNNEFIINSVYANLFNYLEKNISKDFYFEEFNSQTIDNLKKYKFYNSDFFDIENSKQKLKEKINV